ncbi:MAG: hypothetical protein EZS28_041144, partial [Streblomastix strix]
MAVKDNTAKLVIGDNLYIVDKDVTDYWWDVASLHVLETELPDMSNVITTLGTATGEEDAIQDYKLMKIHQYLQKMSNLLQLEMINLLL